MIGPYGVVVAVVVVVVVIDTTSTTTSLRGLYSCDSVSRDFYTVTR